MPYNSELIDELNDTQISSTFLDLDKILLDTYECPQVVSNIIYEYSSNYCPKCNDCCPACKFFCYIQDCPRLTRDICCSFELNAELSKWDIKKKTPLSPSPSPPLLPSLIIPNFILNPVNPLPLPLIHLINPTPPPLIRQSTEDTRITH